jgi:CMP-N,N'-diacetyllegionaminic acid synthase|tara:strand:- start:373 stop:1068 length:696 start_codon:yes stop_codon:yes gene_type:complete
MTVLAIILARKNSKGLKNKNIRLLGGKPLIAHSIELLKKSKLIDDIIVSTDSEAIKKIALKYGAQVPFLRPKRISGDNATTEEALKHCLQYMQNKKKLKPTIIVYLQITEPFRKLWMVDKCILALKKNQKIETAYMAKKFYKNIWKSNKDKFLRLTQEKYGLPRQLKGKYFREDTGLACATRASVVLKGLRIGKNSKPIFYEHDFDYLDIHNNNDLKIANFILNNNLFKIN